MPPMMKALKLSTWTKAVEVIYFKKKTQMLFSNGEAIMTPLCSVLRCFEFVFVFVLFPMTMTIAILLFKSAAKTRAYNERIAYRMCDT